MYHYIRKSKILHDLETNQGLQVHIMFSTCFDYDIDTY